MKRLISIIIVIAVLFTLIGCTGDPVVDIEGVVGAQGVTDTEIIVANSAAISGPYGDIGVEFLAGMNAYFDKVNDEGGVDGRKIKFIHQDDEFDPIKGKAALKHFVEEDKVFAIVGHFGTPVVGATIEDLKNYGIPSVYFATGIGQLYNDNAVGRDRGIYPVQPIYKAEGQIMTVRAVGDFDAKKIGIIYTDDDAGKDLFWGAEQKAKELGVEIVSEQVETLATDVSLAVTAIKNQDVDFIIGASNQGTIGTIIKELAAQEVNKDLITTYVNVGPLVAEQVVADISGKFNVYGNGWVSFEGERARALEVYREHCAEYPSHAYAMTGWIAASFFVEALKRVEGTITWDKYMDALESEPIKNPFGGRIDFSNGRRAGTQEMNLSAIVHDKLNGEWEVVKPLQSIDEILGNK